MLAHRMSADGQCRSVEPGIGPKLGPVLAVLVLVAVCCLETAVGRRLLEHLSL